MPLGAIATGAIGAVKGAAKALGVGGGVPLTRYGQYLSTLAQRRGWSVDRANEWARQAEKTIDDGESGLSFTVTGPEGSEVERMWASRVLTAVAQLSPALTPSEWDGFRGTDRAGAALTRGLIPPRGAQGAPYGTPLGPNPLLPSQTPGAGSGGLYTLPEQPVSGTNLFPLAIVGLIGLAFVARGGK